MNKNILSNTLLCLDLFVCSANDSTAVQISPEQCASFAKSVIEGEKVCKGLSNVCTPDKYPPYYGKTEFYGHRSLDSIYKNYTFYYCGASSCKFPFDYGANISTYTALWHDSCGGLSLPAKASPTIDKPQSACGSMIQLDNQVVGETIPLTGVNFGLSYVSNRVVGRRGDYTIRTLFTPLTIERSDLTEYKIKIWDIDPLTPLHLKSYSSKNANIVTDNFVWKGDDSPASHRLKVQVTEIHEFFTAPSVNEVVIGSLKAKVHGLGGWTPSVLQFYDIVSNTLYRGDGSTRSVDARKVNERACGESVCYDLQVAEEDGSRVYEFDAGGRHLRTRLGLTGSTLFEFSYSIQGALASITEPFQRVTTFRRDGNGDLTAIVGPFGQTTAVTMDINGYLGSVSNPKGDTYKMTYYGAGGLLKTFATPTQRVSAFTYDNDGNLLTDTHSGGRRASISAKSSVISDLRKTLTTREGRVTSVESSFDPGVNPKPDSGFYKRTTIHPSGLRATFSDQSWLTNYFDGHITLSSNFINDLRFGTMARLLSQSTGDLSGASRSIAYKHEVKLTDPQDPFSIINWNTTATTGASLRTTQYDGASRTYNRSSKLGMTSLLKIDAIERPVLTRRGNLLPIALRYTKDHLTQVNQGTRKTTLAYDPVSGLLSDITDPLNRTVSFDYDAAQRVTAQTLPDGRVIRFTYDKAGHLTSVTPPTRPQHRFAINAKDLVGIYSPPLLTAVPQVTTAYSYNNDDQLTRIQRPDGAEITLNYDVATGLLDNMTTPLGAYALTYKPSNDLVSTIKTPDGVRLSIEYSGHLPYLLSWQASDSKIIGSYNRAFNPTTGLINSDSVTAGTGASAGYINYAYDDEFPKQIGDMELSYSVPNSLLSATTLGALKDSYGYSGYGELSAYKTAKGTTKFFSLNFTRDNLGRITQKVQVLVGAGTQTHDYGYDDAGRLKEVSKNGAAFASYVYDDNGNRISGIRNGTVFSADYDDQDRLERQNTLKFAYNANGDLISKTNTSSSAVTLYSYDVFGNLRTVKLPKGTVIDYEIDGLNRRIGKKVNGLLTVRYLYQDQLRIAAELNPDGTLKRRYVYATGRTTPDYYIEGTEKYKIISDYLGSPRAVVKLLTNKIVYRMDHDEFGRVTLDSKPGFLPFGFAGGLYEPTTGLVRFGARDYDPEIGRWTVKDPIRFAGGDTNLYGYVFHNPINFSDPKGLSGGIPIAILPEYRTTARITRSIAEGVGDGYAGELPDDEACPGQSAKGQIKPNFPNNGWHPPLIFPNLEDVSDEDRIAAEPELIDGDF